MKRTITKTECIKALEEENLEPGPFFGKQYGENIKCNVCAVGAILRQTTAVENSIIIDKGDSDPVWTRFMKLNSFASVALGAGACKVKEINQIAQLIEEKKFLPALSSYFEDDWSGKTIDEKRKNCIDFVETYFPDCFQINEKTIEELNSI